MPENFDVVVIGAGPAGYVAAIRAAQLKQKVAIVDKQWLGGVCLNVGCIPSKSLLKNAEVAHTLRERGKEFGFSFENLKLDYGVAVKRSRSNSDRLTKGVGFLMKKNGIAVFMGEARLSGPSAVTVTDKDGKRTDLAAKNIIVATGASAAVPGAWKTDGEKVVTYLEAIVQDKLPKSVVVIGSGAIGVEFSTVWSSYGVDVTIVEMLPRLVPLEDEEISKELEKEFKKRGVKALTGHKVESVEATKTGVKVKVSAAGKETTLEADQALVAIGFRPNSKGLGLEEVGVKISERGFVEVNEKMQTNVPNIYAIGDVTGKLMLAHVGSAMGIVAAEVIAGAETVTLDYEMMPRATYCQPQIASFGLTEAQAKERGYSVKVGRFPFQANGKALGLGDYAGFVKIVMDEKYGEILGAHMIGPEVTELLPELTLAHMMELTPHEIARNVHAHPTISEAIMEAAHGASGQAIHI
ncbi:MAG: dihydrolipoyl dehydrogenase [Anaerolineaceae bacterium]|nr:MAG: dihydrolipoyl dehydrogenase [Anaerolineales bacterium]GIK09165.1 MAG: dihydrolipoyl dehydrogenase [Chloroflexota bacterium]GJQ38825.1 MAG: dihydrolipoyl dehydrogenase [Anaerolineaceae bacterium]HMN00678.1 dihydrolipoyl dehydrogenase [Anaerolineales bacterium]